MKIPTLLPLVLLISLLAACGDGVDAADKTLEDAKAAAKKLADDISKLSMDEIREQGKKAVDDIAAKLREIEDSEDVQRMRESMEPMIDRAIALKEKLGDKLPDSEELRAVVEELENQFEEGSEMRTALQPLFDKLKALFS